VHVHGVDGEDGPGRSGRERGREILAGGIAGARALGLLEAPVAGEPGLGAGEDALVVALDLGVAAHRAPDAQLVYRALERRPPAGRVGVRLGALADEEIALARIRCGRI